MKGILIDSEHRTFRQVDWKEGDVSKYTGGTLTIAFNYPRTDRPQSMVWADIVYCDDEGLMKPTQHFFRTRTRRLDTQPIPGNGFLTGPDIVDERGEYIRCANPQISIARLEKDIEFLTRAQFVAWVKAKKDEPSITVNDMPYAFWRDYLLAGERD
jgi:hypothetical protein